MKEFDLSRWYGHLVRVLQSQLDDSRVVLPQTLGEHEPHPGRVDLTSLQLRIVVVNLEHDVPVEALAPYG